MSERTTEPTTITQGEQIEWTKEFCDYPASEWTLQYRFRGPGTGVNLTSVADGDDFTTTMTAAQSAALAVGKWKWQAVATNIADGLNIQVIGQGDTEVLLGFASSTAQVELRSPARIALESIDAALAAFATSDVLEYEIQTPAGSRRIKKSDKTNLLSMRKYYAGIVANEDLKERMKNGGPFAKPVRARMYER